MSLRCRWFHARERFHDWMWSGSSRPNLSRQIARRLPLYFSDPYYIKPEMLAHLNWQPVRTSPGGITVRLTGEVPHGINLSSPSNCTFTGNRIVNPRRD